MPPDPIAAGGVPWRYDAGVLLLAVVHRPKYDDWSFPKGKLDPGELPLLAALREVSEETGLTVRVGRRLPSSSYQADGTDKTVQWWAMPATGDFSSNDEVDELDWLPVPEAMRRLSYADDIELAQALQQEPPLASRLLLVRHASAGDRGAWTGPDAERPLDERGQAEAATLAAALPWFGPTHVLSAPPLRCRWTVQPLADRLGLAVQDAPEFGEDGYWDDPEATWNRLRGLLRDGTSVAVVCSQGDAIPHLMSRLLRAGVQVTGVSPRRTDPEPPARKGSVWALAADDAGQLRRADYYGSFLPG